MSEPTITLSLSDYNHMAKQIEGLEEKYDYFYCQNSHHYLNTEIWILKTNKDELVEELRDAKKKFQNAYDELKKYQFKFGFDKV